MTNPRLPIALALLLFGCGTNDRCDSLDVLLTSNAPQMVTYQLSFKDTSCDIFVPGANGFEPGTPESITCDTDNQGSFLVFHRDPTRPDCKPEVRGEDFVSQGTCWDGEPQTLLIWVGPLRPTETLVFTLSSEASSVEASRTVELSRPSCDFEPIEIDLSD